MAGVATGGEKALAKGLNDLTLGLDNRGAVLLVRDIG